MHKDFYRIRPDFEDIHLKLEKANILFHNGSAACHHINKVWNNIDDWWEDEKVKKIRKSFEKLTCKNLSEKETTKEWIKYFKKFI